MKRNFLISHRIKHKVVLLVVLTVFVIQVSDYLVSCNNSLWVGIPFQKEIVCRHSSSICASLISQICQRGILRLNLTSILYTTDIKLADTKLRELRGSFVEVKEKSVVVIYVFCKDNKLNDVWREEHTQKKFRVSDGVELTHDRML